MMNARMKTTLNGIGQPVRRVEDVRLVSGKGQYSDDWRMEGQAHAVVVRSPHAHARIRAIDASRAKAAPGVLAALTGTDVAADGLSPIPSRAVGHDPREPRFANSRDRKSTRLNSSH